MISDTDREAARLAANYRLGFDNGMADAEFDLANRAPVDALADDHLAEARETLAHSPSRTTVARDLGYARGYRAVVR